MYDHVYRVSYFVASLRSLLVGLIETESYAKSSFHVLQLYTKKRLVVLTTASGWLPWLRGLHVLFRGISDCVYISEPIMFIKMVFSCSPVDGRAQFSLY